MKELYSEYLIFSSASRTSSQNMVPSSASLRLQSVFMSLPGILCPFHSSLYMVVF